MGPLSKLWVKLFKARKANSKHTKFNVDKVLKNVEQYILLLGQTNVSLCFHRQVSMVEPLVGKYKEAKKLVHKYSRRNFRLK